MFIKYSSHSLCLPNLCSFNTHHTVCVCQTYVPNVCTFLQEKVTGVLAVAEYDIRVALLLFLPAEKGRKAGFFLKLPLWSRKFSGLKFQASSHWSSSLSTECSMGMITVSCKGSEVMDQEVCEHCSSLSLKEFSELWTMKVIDWFGYLSSPSVGSTTI